MFAIKCAMCESLIFDVAYVHLSIMWNSSLPFAFSLEPSSNLNNYLIFYKNRQKMNIWYYNFDAKLCLWYFFCCYCSYGLVVLCTYVYIAHTYLWVCTLVPADVEYRGQHLVSSSIAINLIFWDRVSHGILCVQFCLDWWANKTLSYWKTM